jgi:hypothetical protein
VPKMQATKSPSAQCGAGADNPRGRGSHTVLNGGHFLLLLVDGASVEGAAGPRQCRWEVDAEPSRPNEGRKEVALMSPAPEGQAARSLY